MSSNKKTQADKGSSFFHKKKVTTLTAKMAGLLPVTFEDDSRIEYVRLSTGSPRNVTLEYLFHRPVGITDLAADCWVRTKPSEFQLLLQRREDPKAKKVQAERDVWLLDAAVGQGLLVKNGRDYYYPDDDDMSRVAHIADCRNLWATTAKEKEKFDLLSCMKGSSETWVNHERAFIAFCRNNRARAESAVPTEYRTIGGHLHDEPQCSVPWAKGLSKNELQAVVFKHGAAGPPPDPPEMPDTEDDEEEYKFTPNHAGKIPPGEGITIQYSGASAPTWTDEQQAAMRALAQAFPGHYIQLCLNIPAPEGSSSVAGKTTFK